MRRVAVTGWALASPFGSDPDAFWHGIGHGPAPLSNWHSEPDFPELSCLICPLPGDRPALSPAERTRDLSASLSRQALRDAGYDRAPEGLGLALGSCWLEGDYLALPRRSAPEPLLPALAQELALTGPVTGLPVACCSANLALAWAFERVRRGETEAMLAGGLDVAGSMAVGGYLFLGTMTEARARPFGRDRDGFVLGEGGAIFLLEPLDQVRRAGRRALAELVAVGLSHDGAHPTRPAADGRGLVHAMRQALAEGGLAPSEIGYVNAHSPGTWANDPGEAAAIATVFGPRAVPVSSTKAALGHAQGGANAHEAVACILALRHQTAPPTLGLTDPDPELELDLVLAPRPLDTRYALSIASSMGGANGVVVFGRGDRWD